MRTAVIMPAHDEAATIGRNLTVLLSEDLPIEVIVIANGCSDATAEIAGKAMQEARHDGQVLSLGKPSKTAALRLGDTVAASAERVYLDADVQCPPATMAAILVRLKQSHVDLCVPSRDIELDAATWWCRAYYSAWQRLPRVKQELSGRGCFAFSAHGRQEFTQFPDVVADDQWAVRQVDPARASIIAESVRIRPPQTLRSLIRVRTRVFAANRELGPTGTSQSLQSDVWCLIGRPRHLPSALVYVGVTAVAKFRARMLASELSLASGRDRSRGGREPDAA